MAQEPTVKGESPTPPGAGARGHHHEETTSPEHGPAGADRRLGRQLSLQSISKIKLLATTQRRRARGRQLTQLASTAEGDEPAGLSPSASAPTTLAPTASASTVTVTEPALAPVVTRRRSIATFETPDAKWKAVVDGQLEAFMYPSLRLEALYRPSTGGGNDEDEDTDEGPRETTKRMPTPAEVDAALAAQTRHVHWTVERRYQNAAQSAPGNGHPRMDARTAARVSFDTQLEAAEGLLRRKEQWLLEAKRQQGLLEAMGNAIAATGSGGSVEASMLADAHARPRGASLYEPHVINSPQVIPRLPHTRKILKEIQRHTTDHGQIAFYADKANLFTKWKKLQVTELHKLPPPSRTSHSRSSIDTRANDHDAADVNDVVRQTLGPAIDDLDDDDEEEEATVEPLTALSPRSLFYRECVRKHVLPEPIFSRIHDVQVARPALLLPKARAKTAAMVAAAEGQTSSSDAEKSDHGSQHKPSATSFSSVAQTLVQHAHAQHTQHEDLVPTADGRYATKRHHLALHLQHFGLGDRKLAALSTSLRAFPSIHVLDLQANRLTDAAIIPLLESLAASAINAAHSPTRRNGHDLRALNLSQNTLGVAGCRQIAAFIRLCPRLTHLDLSQTTIRGTDAVGPLTQALETHGALQVVNLSSNGLTAACAELVGAMLVRPSCAVTDLDLSWNEICHTGAVAIGQALRKNKTLRRLRLAMNRFADDGGEAVAAAMAVNTTLEELDLARNQLGGRSAVAFGFFLRQNRSLQHLRLEDNCLGPTGAKALLRAVTLGSPCEFHLTAHDIEATHTVAAADPIFEALVPSSLSPFVLRMGQSPYDFAVASELVDAATRLGCCRLSQLTFVDDRQVSMTTIPLSVDVERQRVIETTTQRPWSVPDYGQLRATVAFVPPPLDVTPGLDTGACHALVRLIRRGFSTREVGRLLELAVEDLFMTTTLAEIFVEGLLARGLDIVTITGQLWPCLVDGDRAYAFLQRHLSPSEQRRLMDVVGLMTVQFTTANPTGHWVLDLGDHRQRKLALAFAMLNARDAQDRPPRRTDPTQYGRGYAWRNARYNRQPLRLTYEFFDHLPTTGVLEFDYVSSRRYEELAVAPPVMADAELEQLMTGIGAEVFAIYVPLPKRPDVKYQLVLFHVAIGRHYLTLSQAHRILQYFPKTYEPCRRRLVLAMHRPLVEIEGFAELLELRLTPSDRRRVMESLGYLNVVNPLALDHLDFAVDFEREDEKQLLRGLVDLSMTCPMDMIRIDAERSTVLVIYSMYQTNTIPSTGRICFRYVTHGPTSRHEFWRARAQLFRHFLCGERLRVQWEQQQQQQPSTSIPSSASQPSQQATAPTAVTTITVVGDTPNM